MGSAIESHLHHNHLLDAVHEGLVILLVDGLNHFVDLGLNILASLLLCTQTWAYSDLRSCYTIDDHICAEEETGTDSWKTPCLSE